MIKLINHIRYNKYNPSTILEGNEDFGSISSNQKIYTIVFYSECKAKVHSTDIQTTYIKFTDYKPTFEVLDDKADFYFKEGLRISQIQSEISDYDEIIFEFMEKYQDKLIEFLKKSSQEIMYPKWGYEELDEDPKTGILTIAICGAFVVEKEEHEAYGFLRAKYKVLADEIKDKAVDYCSCSSPDLQRGYDEITSLTEWVDGITLKYHLDPALTTSLNEIQKMFLDKGVKKKKELPKYTISLIGINKDNENEVYEKLKDLSEIIEKNYCKTATWNVFKQIMTGKDLTVKLVWSKDIHYLSYFFRKLQPGLKCTPKKWDAVCHYFVPNKDEQFKSSQLEFNTSCKAHNLFDPIIEELLSKLSRN